MRQESGNPCRNIEKFKERSRERFLSEVEIARLGEALGQAQASGSPPAAIVAIRLPILSDARKGEILGLQWRWVSFERSLIELPDSDSGSKVIYLNAPATALLASLPHIVNIEKTWRRARHVASLDDVRIHDLRHSFAAVGARAGFSLPLIGALFGHAEVATTQRYAHLGNDPARQANEANGARIAAALGAPVRVAS